MAGRQLYPLGYTPALDGLRAFLTCGIILHHALEYGAGVPHWMKWGINGLDAFFVLSGYLITGTLLKEFDERGRISLAAFYWRRLLRLFPALVFCCVVLLAIDEAGLCQGCEIPQSVGAALLYVMNFVRVLTSFNGGLLAHCWTLAIEEQFYLIWAPLLGIFGAIALRTRVSINVFTAGAAVATVLWLMAMYLAGRVSRVIWPDMWIYAFAFGGLLAALMRTQSRATLIRCAALLGPLALVAIVCKLPVPLPFGWLVILLVSGTLILCAHSISWLSRAASNDVATWIGERSYGLYLWHYPVNLLFWHWGWIEPNPLFGVLASTCTTFAIAAFSYEFIERPILSYRYAFPLPAR